MARKCFTLIVATSKPRCRAVAPMSRSGKSCPIEETSHSVPTGRSFIGGTCTPGFTRGYYHTLPLGEGMLAQVSEFPPRFGVPAA